MASVLDRATAHFKAIPVQSVEVPEWGEGGKPLKVFFNVPNAKTIAMCAAASKGDMIEYGARLVAQCAMDESGKRLFSGPDYLTLMVSCHPSVVSNLANAIAAAARLDVSEAGIAGAEKN